MADLTPRPAIAALPPDDNRLPDGRAGKVRLDCCEWPGALPDRVLQALRNITPEQLSTYPEAGRFGGELAAFLGLPSGDHVRPVNGGAEALSLAVRAYLKPGDRAVVVTPHVGSIPRILQQHEIETVPVPLLRVAAAGGPVFAFDLDGIESALEAGAKALIIASPNNPTGTWCEPTAWLELAARFTDRLFVIDEAYADYAPARLHTRLSYRLKNLIVTGTFSKVLGLAGIRLGWVSGHPEMLRVLDRVQLPHAVNALSLHVARSVIAAPEEIDDRIVQTLDGTRVLAEGLRRRGILCSRAQGNTVIAWAGIDADWLAEGLSIDGILVRNLAHDRGTEGGVRITGGPAEMMQRLLRAIDRCLDRRPFVIGDARRTMLATALRGSTLARRYDVTPPSRARAALQSPSGRAPEGVSMSARYSAVGRVSRAGSPGMPGDPPAVVDPSRGHAVGTPGGDPAGSSVPGRGSGGLRGADGRPAKGYWLASRDEDVVRAREAGFLVLGLAEGDDAADRLRAAGAIAIVRASHGEHGVADISDSINRIFSYAGPPTAASLTAEEPTAAASAALYEPHPPAEPPTIEEYAGYSHDAAARSDSSGHLVQVRAADPSAGGTDAAPPIPDADAADSSSAE